MSTGGLYNADGNFVPFSSAELSTELATRQNAGVLFGELDGWLSTLPDPDPVLRKRGDDAEVLRELSADDQVTTAMLSRKNRVLNCPHFSGQARRREKRPRRKRRNCTGVSCAIWSGRTCARSSAGCWTRLFTESPLLN